VLAIEPDIHGCDYDDGAGAYVQAGYHMHMTQYEIFKNPHSGAAVRIATVETLGRPSKFFTLWLGLTLVIISREIAPQVKS
jgi:hypothetical protein